MATFAFVPSVDGAPVFASQPFSGTSPSDAALENVIFQVKQLMATSGANDNLFANSKEAKNARPAETVRASGPASVLTLVTLVDCPSAGDAPDIELTLADGTEGQSKTIILAQPLTRCRIVTGRGAVLLDGIQQLARLLFVGRRWYLLPENTPAAVPQQIVAYRPVATLNPPSAGLLGAHLGYTGDRVWAWSAGGAWSVWNVAGPAPDPKGIAPAAYQRWPILGSSALPLSGPVNIRRVWFRSDDAEVLIWDYASPRSRLVWYTLDSADGRPVGTAAVTEMDPSFDGTVVAAPDLSWALVGTQIWVQNPQTHRYAPAPALVPSPPADTQWPTTGSDVVADISANSGVLVLGSAASGRISTYTVSVATGAVFYTASLNLPVQGGPYAGLGRRPVAVSPTGRTIAAVLDGGSFLVYTDGSPSPSALVTCVSGQNIDCLVVRDGLIVAGSRSAGAVWTLAPQEGGPAPGMGLAWQPISVARGRDAVRDPDFGSAAFLSLDASTLLVPGTLAQPGPMYLFS